MRWWGEWSIAGSGPVACRARHRHIRHESIVGDDDRDILRIAANDCHSRHVLNILPCLHRLETFIGSARAGRGGLSGVAAEHSDTPLCSSSTACCRGLPGFRSASASCPTKGNGQASNVASYSTLDSANNQVQARHHPWSVSSSTRLPSRAIQSLSLRILVLLQTRRPPVATHLSLPMKPQLHHRLRQSRLANHAIARSATRSNQTAPTTAAPAIDVFSRWTITVPG
jgi:hypothetical protein